ncbi:MAG: amidohydrolase family protein [Acidimicrobiales bacterium]|nr:amidohydrolase family protein [Acidimicrobiales bacterium]
MIIHDVEVEGRAGQDVVVDGARIAAVGPRLVATHPGHDVLDGRGGALLPGLHDHHLHLRSMAARHRSVACGPPEVDGPEAFAAALTAAAATLPAGRWIRGVGYDERIVGPVDRARLDDLAPRHPLRIQHRSGHLWVVNSPALDRLADVPDAARLDGHLYDADDRFRGLDEHDPAEERATLAAVAGRLAAQGITGVTDATADNDRRSATWFAERRADGTVPFDVHVLGEDDLTDAPRKVILAEHDLPALDDLIATVVATHAADRPVAIHAASRATVVLALAALDAAGAHPGDRIEHASVAPPELASWMARIGVTVVTQPAFVRSSGDRYLDEVDAEDQPWLYRCRGLIDAGVRLAAGSDAPFGPADPWLAMQAAIDRRTAAGAVLGPDESLTPEQAVALFTGPADDPGGPSRRVAPGAPADLCLLAVPWVEARRRLTADYVAATIVAGALIAGG